jgi:hypothetical protein
MPEHPQLAVSLPNISQGFQCVIDDLPPENESSLMLDWN